MAAFEAESEALRDEGIAVIAASTDALDEATETVETLGLGFPVGFGVPLRETADALGAYYEERRNILHGTGFVVRPDGTIAIALYSSGAIGRLVPEDVLSLVRFWKQREG